MNYPRLTKIELPRVGPVAQYIGLRAHLLSNINVLVRKITSIAVAVIKYFSITVFVIKITSITLLRY